MKKLLVLALSLLAVNAFAQADATADGIGWYFDEATAASNCIATVPNPGTRTYAYLLATNISEDTGISGWEAKVYVSDSYVPVDDYYFTVAGTGYVNPLVEPEFGPGYAVALPYAPIIRLLRLAIYSTGAPYKLGVGPIAPERCSFDPPSPGYTAGDDPGKTIPLVPSSNVVIPDTDGYWVAGVGGDFCPVAIENDSWGAVKNLYQ